MRSISEEREIVNGVRLGQAKSIGVVVAINVIRIDAIAPLLATSAVLAVMIARTLEELVLSQFSPAQPSTADPRSAAAKDEASERQFS